ncbi:MAG: transcription-repair coupling factor [Chitinivibrionales bacterium]|nr:transcription-repair coupling factor [Chitinivibrionales bacterium]
MEFKKFSDIWHPHFFPQISTWERERPDSALFKGLAGSSDAVLISGLFAASQQTQFVIVDHARRAEVLCDECKSIAGGDNVFLFPSRDAIPYNMKSPFGPTVEARYRVLDNLLKGVGGIYIATASCLLQKIQPQKTLYNSIIRLHNGDEVSLDTLSAWLTQNGFRRENQVENLGTFSIRGGIVDIYPFITDNPVRIEFWGDTIESMREFDIFTQRSLQRRSALEIFPMREFVLGSDQISTGLEALTDFCELKGIDLKGVDRLEHQWKLQDDLDGIEWFLSWFDLKTATILDYLPHDALVVWDDLLGVEHRLQESRQNYLRHIERVPELFLPLISPPEALLMPDERIRQDLACFARVYGDTREIDSETVAYSCALSEQPSYPHTIEFLTADLAKYHREGSTITILAASPGSAERLHELIAEDCPYVKIYLGSLKSGYVDKTNNYLLFSEQQLFNRPVQRATPKKIKSGIPLKSFDALAPDDYIVHVDHGIGRFIGIQRIAAADAQRDCMVLQFQGASKLFVPVEDFHKVQKYRAGETVQPTLSKLGSGTWERLKRKTKESLREMAQELIELYATRTYHEGICFGPDSNWQQEFEDAFVFEATPDQARAIAESKKDMESNKPMDRLVCGDVGFGKTEVAMRAAFKAVIAGYQVAVLAPTTILASQHYATFSERMANFPVKIDVLSRFRKPGEQRRTILHATSGAVDIIIGTHRLLSKDISFKNLGLLIIDEEQKFGVRHKEKLKHFRSQIDVLSLTATPIPRTLHMSLVGARDLSIINTPPQNRLPVETTVAEFHDELVKNAVENELARGGQVYFVHNRVKNLHTIQEKVELLAPRARVIAAHGQMHERELETVMNAFVAGRYDVLVSTVIIENGLDIANVNTIIVNRADALGLSQLYQLRGRVGRSSEQAYAYLLTPSFKKMDEISLRRLRALEQYTELGSGFQIAMRDLEIRGAGNILGTKQHGFIAAVGFELYCRLLQEAVSEAKGEPPPQEMTDVKVDIPLEAFIPAEYIADGATRVTLYQELSSLEQSAAIDEIEQELVDRFGPLPQKVSSLLLVMRIKVLAGLLGSASVALKDRTLHLTFEGDDELVKKRLQSAMSSGHSFEIAYAQPISLKLGLSAVATADQATEIVTILTDITGVHATSR